MTQKISFAHPGTRKYTLTVVTCFFGAITFLATVASFRDSPAQRNDSALQRTAPAWAFAGVIYYWLSLNRILLVDVKARELMIRRYAFFVLQYSARTIPFRDIDRVEYSRQMDEDFDRILRIYLVTKTRRIEIMRRYRGWDLQGAENTARTLAATVSVPFEPSS